MSKGASMRMAVPFIMQNAHKKRKFVVLSCPKLSFKIKKTTGDNFEQLINNEETTLHQVERTQEKKDCCPKLS